MRFSDRKIKGLPLPKEFIVKDLAGYIKFFSNGKYKNFLFRGEPTNYSETSSSGLRGNTVPSLTKMKEEFKREVWHKLSEDERLHFNAFSQHHGIPTNLVDITISPLIALYFACQDFKDLKDEKLDEKRGFVYLFEDNMIDITSVLTKYGDENFLEMYAYNKNGILFDMYKLFLNFEKKNPYMFYKHLKNLNEDYYEYCSSIFEKNSIPKKFIPYNEGKYKEEIFKMVLLFDDEEEAKELSEKIKDGLDYSFAVFLYTSYLQKFLKKIINSKEPIFWFNVMPIFKYSPILSFDRGRNQQGLFIYQSYLHYVEDVYDTEILAEQRVWPSQIIVIENKETIRKELDFLGFHQKFIYGDYDNVASYIKKKYL
ncbi:FRG domain-containing protein [Saccharibacillus sp. CPCC 101409]|uniref:FRG domain-containing protein n=1 Tax=Saccharibacillus sp. CPCC 101409 TaxID=3058041 RepID=UPI002672ED45|nr:FRG domain-containing protein [Saccharibacillus sp. CPCC 101409]MDO3412581.1 FRG domain-containing protein [Saccharibacillus sp. CPCC 101409]